MYDPVRYFSFNTQYVVSLYLTYTTITGTGYGDIVPVNSEGRILAIVIMVIGVIIFSFSSANVGMLVRGNVTFQGHMLEQKKVLTMALKRRNFPIKQIEKLRIYYEKSLEDKYFRDELMLIEKLPFKLRVDFCRFRFQEVMNRVPLFKYIKNDSVKVYLLLNVLQSETVESGVELIKFGTKVEGCLFLHVGDGLICRPLPSALIKSISLSPGYTEVLRGDGGGELDEDGKKRSNTVDSRDCYFSRDMLNEREGIVKDNTDEKDNNTDKVNNNTDKVDDSTDKNDKNTDKTASDIPDGVLVSPKDEYLDTYRDQNLDTRLRIDEVGVVVEENIINSVGYRDGDGDSYRDDRSTYSLYSLHSQQSNSIYSAGSTRR